MTVFYAIVSNYSKVERHSALLLNASNVTTLKRALMIFSLEYLKSIMLK